MKGIGALSLKNMAQFVKTKSTSYQGRRLPPSWNHLDILQLQYRSHKQAFGYSYQAIQRETTNRNVGYPANSI